MKKYLSNSDASYPLGIAAGKKLLKVQSGEYAGRRVALFQSGAGEIRLTYADYPYVDWSSPSSVISDGADSPFDAVIDSDGNIYLVYSLVATNNLVLRKLSLADGLWSVGSLNTIYEGDDNFYPSIIKEPSGRLWISWSRLAAGSYYINVKFSDDDGASWPNGSSSAGTSLTGAENSAFSKMILCNNYLYAIYTRGGVALAYCRKHFSAGTWETELLIASGSALDEHFDAAVSENGRIGILFDDNRVRFREYDGVIWSGIVEIDSGSGEFPQVAYSGNEPSLLYLSAYGSSQKRILFSRRSNNLFSNPAVLDRRKDALSRLLCYSSSSGTYQDLTAAAASDTTGDIFHTTTGAMLKESGDALYFGMDEKFNFLNLRLSQSGSGGGALWQYFDGADWQSFSPAGGLFDFSLSNKELLLWEDYLSIPLGWQKKTVNGAEKFWVRVVVNVPYATGPVGSQITSITEVQSFILAE